MSTQGMLNQIALEAIDFQSLAKLAKNEFSLNQMKYKALHEMLNSRIAIDDMNDNQLKSFKADLKSIFKYHEWI